MASIWVHFAGEKSPVKAIGSLSKSDAIKLFHRKVSSFIATQGSGTFTVRRVFDHEVLVFKEGKLHASLFIEFFSPPSAPEKGQPKRMAA